LKSLDQKNEKIKTGTMKRLIVISCMLLTAISNKAQQSLPDKTEPIIMEGTKINIPEGSCRQIIVDGKFYDNEWYGAIRIQQQDNYTILLKADNESLVVGLRFPEPKGSLVSEIRFTCDDKEVFLLHSSGAPGEGKSGFPCTTKFGIKNNYLWETNCSVKDPEKEAAWITAGSPMEKYDEVYIKRDGIEYKISRKKISGSKIKLTIGWIWVEIMDGKPYKKIYNYPAEAGMLSPDNWAELILPVTQE